MSIKLTGAIVNYGGGARHSLGKSTRRATGDSSNQVCSKKNRTRNMGVGGEGRKKTKYILEEL